MLKRYSIVIALIAIFLPGVIEAGAKEEIERGSNLFSKEKYEEALALYENLVETYPDSEHIFFAYREIGRAYIKLGQYGKGEDILIALIEECAHIQQARPACASALGILASRYSTPIGPTTIAPRTIDLLNDDLRRLKGYEPFVRRIVTEYPDVFEETPEFVLRLKNLTFRQGKGAESLPYAKLHYYICPLRGEKVHRAVDWVASALEAADNSKTRRDKFLLYQKYGSTGRDGKLGTQDDLSNLLRDIQMPIDEEARERYQSVLKIYGDDREGHRRKGYIYLFWDKPDKALEEFKAAYALCTPTDAESLRNATDDLAKALRALHGNTLVVRRFFNFQEFGTKGRDGKAGTKDDLSNPLELPRTASLNPDANLNLPETEKATKEDNYKKVKGLLERIVLEPSATIEEKRQALRKMHDIAGRRDEWPDFLEFYKKLYEDEKIADPVILELCVEEIIRCYNAIDFNLAKANDFLRAEMSSAKGARKKAVHTVFTKLRSALTNVSLEPASEEESLPIGELYSLAKEGGDEAVEFVELYDVPHMSPTEAWLALADFYMRGNDFRNAARTYRVFLKALMESSGSTELIKKAASGLIMAYEMQNRAGELPSIWQEMTEALVLRGKSPVLIEGIVEGLREWGNYEEAKEFCMWCISEYPDHKIAITALEALSDSTLYAPIAKEYRNYKVGIEAKRLWANYLFKSRKFEEAIPLYENLLSQHAGHPDERLFWERLGQSYEKTGDYQNAEDCYRVLIRDFLNFEESVTTLRHLANSYYQSGNYGKSIEILREIANRFPGEKSSNAVDALQRIGEIYYEIEEYGQAIESYKKAANLISPILGLKEEIAEEKAPSELLKAKCEFWLNYVNFAQREDKKSLSAIEDFIGQYSDTPEAADGQYLLAKYYLKEKQLENALTHIDKVLNLAPESEKAPYLAKAIDIALEAVHQIDLKIQKKEDIIKSAADENTKASAHYAIARLYEQKHDFNCAINELEKLVAKFPEVDAAPKALHTMALLAEDKLNDKEKAHSAYARLALYYPDNVLSYEALKNLAAMGMASGYPAIKLEAIPQAVARADLNAIKNNYHDERYDLVLEKAWPLFRKIVGAYPNHPGIRAFGRQLLIISQAGREISKKTKIYRDLVPRGAKKEKFFALWPFAGILYDRFTRLKGESRHLPENLGPDEQNFTEILRSSVLKEQDKQVFADYRALASKYPEHRLVKDLTKHLWVYLLVTRPTKEILDEADSLPQQLWNQESLKGMASIIEDLPRERLTLAQIYEKAGHNYLKKPEEAISTLEKAADIYKELNRIGNEINAYKIIVDKFPEHKRAAEAQFNIILLYAQEWKAYENAAAECQKLITMFPDDPQATQARFLIGLFYYQAKEYEKSVEYLQKFVTEYPDTPWTVQAHLLIALNHIADLKSDKAREELRNLVKTFPNHELAPRAQYLLGYSYLSEQKYEQAKVEFQKLLDNYPKSNYARDARRYIQRLLSLPKTE